jgi:2-polyprenyl-3-methyl-5-hydroxy-6-metoxy-1,4-benzoquinol methylase
MNLNYLRYRIAKPFKSWKNKYLKYITKKEAEKFDLYEKIAEEISEYTNEPIEIVKQKHKLGPESERNFDIFKHQANLSKGEVEEFYRKCNYYIYELPLWNAERSRPKYLYLICLPYLKRNNYKKVMDFGAGTGDLCIELAKMDLDVTYCDIGEELFDFAKWRFQRRNLPIKVVRGIDNINEIYDCIFSFDTFEHIKDLPGVLKVLIKYIKLGGSLIFSGAFSGGTLHLEENEKYNEFKELDKLMQNYGLIFQDKFAQFYFYKRIL